MNPRALLATFPFVALGLLFAGPTPSPAQDVRIDVGGGWAPPTNNVESQEIGSAQNDPPLSIDLEPGAHVYAGLGFVRSIGENFNLGARVRGQLSRLSAIPDCGTAQCSDPDGRLRALTVEGRVILTSPDWIQPYFLVGLGIVHATVESVTAQFEGQTFTFSEVSVTDAGGDVGFGASFPLAGGLMLDAELRATGALPGGKENAVTTVPMSLGLAYQF